MQITLNKIKQNNLIMFDIEYEETQLIQVAMLVFQRQSKTVFGLIKSINVYIKPDHHLNSFFTNYTNITNDFLEDNGLSPEEAVNTINKMLEDINLDDTLFISHGVKNDMLVLKRNGIVFPTSARYCTCENAKRLLKRTNHLTLAEVAAEGCYYTYNAHNAYADAMSVLFAFCYLNELEYGEKNGY